MRSPPPTAATMRARRMIDAMTCRELPAAAMGPPSRSAEGCLGTMRQERGRSDRMYLRMPSKHCRKRISQARRLEPNQTNRRAKVLPREDSLAILFSKLPMLQQEAESSRMSMLAKVSLRENSLVFFGAELPMLQRVTTGTDKFFYHHAVGWFVG